jgi:hypothetical protein
MAKAQIISEKHTLFLLLGRSLLGGSGTASSGTTSGRASGSTTT